MTNANQMFWLSTRPYTLVDAINRAAAATGSVRYAQAAAGANYNGHSVSVAWNEYRKYWVTEYYWGERVVLYRGRSLEQALQAAKQEYDRGALGARCTFTARDENEAAAALAAGWSPTSREAINAHYRTFSDDRFGEVGHALRDRTDHLLLQAATVDEYRALCRSR